MTVTYSHRGDHAVVHLTGEIDSETAVELVDVFALLQSVYFYRELELVVTSNGGSHEALACVLEALAQLERDGVHARIRVVSHARSAGALLLSLGAERVAAPAAALHFHSASACELGRLHATGARALHRSLSGLDEAMCRSLAERALRTAGRAAAAPAPFARARDGALLAPLLEALRPSRRSRRRAAARTPVTRLAKRLSQHIGEVIERGDKAALARLYAVLFALDAPLSPALARTLRLIDRVDSPHCAPVDDARGAPDTPALVVPEWKALYPPEGAVPLASLTRHALVLGETGSGKTASAVVPLLGAAAALPPGRLSAALVIDPKRELEPALRALGASQRLRLLAPSDVVLDLMSDERWSLDADLAVGRFHRAALRVVRRVVSLVPEAPARVLDDRESGRDPYWALEGTELLVTVVALLLILLRTDPSPLYADDSIHRDARAWLRHFYARAAGEGEGRGPNLVALAGWALRSALMRMCATRGSFWSDTSAAVAFVGSVDDEDCSGGWLCAHVARALMAHERTLSSEARDVLERVLAHWDRLARVRNTFVGVLGSAVASTVAFAAPPVATSLYFGVEPGLRHSPERRLDFARAVSRDGDGCLYVFQPARDDIDRLIAVALKACFFESVLADPDRQRGDAQLPLILYAADEAHRFVTSDRVHGEASFFDSCRSYGAACIVACQAVASLEHALSHAGGGARRDDAALTMIWTNTATKLIFRTTDPATVSRLAAMAPERRGLTDVVRARPPSTLAVGEAYCVLPDGRFERRQLEPAAVPEREAARENAPRALPRPARRQPVPASRQRALAPPRNSREEE